MTTGGPFRDREHLVRMGALFGAGLAAFLVLRAALVPADFGELGHYRTGALQDTMIIPAAFAGQAVCADCHDDVADERSDGGHANISCEACHGALAGHANGLSDAVPELPDAAWLCASCHEAAAAKPDWFPQVETGEHAGGDACVDCHLPHRPGL